VVNLWTVYCPQVYHMSVRYGTIHSLFLFLMVTSC